MAATRMAIVAVIGSGGDLSPAEAAPPMALGRWLAERGHHLLTGGGGGVMAAVSRGFCSLEPPRRRGLSIGVLPAGRDPAVYPNAWVEIPIRTHLLGYDPRGADSRNPINVLSAAAIVAFPGRAGTRAELELAARHLPARTVAVLAAGQTVGGLTAADVEVLGLKVVDEIDEATAFLAACL